MSELPITDDKVLAFDLNQCSDREFCEVFGADGELARNLIEYRQEVLHIFKFEQLLKLRGMSRERLQEWTAPKTSDAPNAELQGALGLQVEKPEPLQGLLAALSRRTGAAGCLMAARDGAMVLNTSPGEPAYETLAAVVSQFVRPVQEDMLQMSLGTADTQVVSYEQNELIFLPASAFYLAVLQPAGKITAENMKLWKDLAAEVRKRVPPRMVIDNHAKVTDSDIAFDCPKCYLRLVVDRAGAGFGFPCPRCKNQVTVPPETTSFSSFIQPKDLVVDSKGA
jgi:predicted regulator of Ras-like GTPase activity (Roadblock/LC7/MglB family)